MGCLVPFGRNGCAGCVGCTLPLLAALLCLILPPLIRGAAAHDSHTVSRPPASASR